MRKIATEDGPEDLPSSVVVIDQLFGAKKPADLKRSCSYCLCCHDWQVLPTRFWTKRKAQKVVTCRRAIRSKQKVGGVVTVKRKGRLQDVDMLTQSSSSQEMVKVKPRFPTKRERRF